MSVADGSLLRFEDEAALRATGWDIARAVRLTYAWEPLAAALNTPHSTPY